MLSKLHFSHRQKFYLELVNQFLLRDLKARYNSAFLGIIWMFFYPTITTILSVLVFSLTFQKNIYQVPYYLFVIPGITAWYFFNQTILLSVYAPIQNRRLILNADFPRSTIIVATAIFTLINYLLNLSIFFLLLVLQTHTRPFQLILFFIPLLLQSIFQIGLAFLLSTINVFYRDIQNALGILLQIVFYCTPTFYPYNIVPPHLRFLFYLNPLAMAIHSQRQIIFQNLIPWRQLILLSFVAILTLLGGYSIFKKFAQYFADAI